MQGDDLILEWVRKQLESGDDPKIIKTILKNRGLDPCMVDEARSSMKKQEPPPAKKEPKAKSKKKKEQVPDVPEQKEGSAAMDDPPPPPPDNMQAAILQQPDRIEIRPHPGRGVISRAFFALRKKTVEIAEIPVLFVKLVLSRVSGIMARGPKTDAPKIPTADTGGMGKLLLWALSAIVIIAVVVSFGLDWYVSSSTAMLVAG